MHFFKGILFSLSLVCCCLASAFADVVADGGKGGPEKAAVDTEEDRELMCRMLAVDLKEICLLNSIRNLGQCLRTCPQTDTDCMTRCDRARSAADARCNALRDRAEELCINDLELLLSEILPLLIGAL